jgi:predicted DCC family thiol-disulfide oxidoreductase YuxK
MQICAWSMQQERAIFLYDGECGLCNSTVIFLLDNTVERIAWAFVRYNPTMLVRSAGNMVLSNRIFQQHTSSTGQDSI